MHDLVVPLYGTAWAETKKWINGMCDLSMLLFDMKKRTVAAVGSNSGYDNPAVNKGVTGFVAFAGLA
jgi:hypothetical protein